MKKTFDILIAGAGASGLAAAIEAARTDPSLSVALLERDPKVGQKLLVTGNGRCNLFNESISPEDYNSRYECYPAVAEELKNCAGFFGSLGLLTWTDADGRVYPYSNQASAVLNVLRQETARLGVTEVTGFEIADMQKRKDGFLLTSSLGDVVSGKKLIIAVGTPAGRKKETNGGLYRQLEKLGHPVASFRPALCPLDTDPARVKSLKGLRAKAGVSLLRDGKAIRSSAGEVQFAEGYLGGICVMDLSAWAEEGDVLSLDLIPGMGSEELAGYLIGMKGNCTQTEQILSGCLSKGLAQLAVADSGLKNKKAAAELRDEDMERLARVIKDMRFPVTGFPGTARAQICIGGVSPDSLDAETLESLRTEGLYFCGEMLGVAGRCGGFNLAWAWASGRTAGRNAAG